MLVSKKKFLKTQKLLADANYRLQKAAYDLDNLQERYKDPESKVSSLLSAISIVSMHLHLTHERTSKDQPDVDFLN